MWPSASNANASEYELVAPNGHAGEDVDFDEEIRRLEEGAEGDEEERVEGKDKRNPRNVTWGETRVLGE
jgi:hypothetical protein